VTVTFWFYFPIAFQLNQNLLPKSDSHLRKISRLTLRRIIMTMKKLWGIPVILLAMVLFFGCGDGNDNGDDNQGGGPGSGPGGGPNLTPGDGGGTNWTPSMNGTWADSDGDTLILNNGNFEMTSEQAPAFRGTLTTTSATAFTMTITLIHGSQLTDTEAFVEFGVKSTQWYTKTQLTNLVIDYFVEEMEEYMTRDEVIEYLADDLEYLDSLLGMLFFTMTGTYVLSGNNLTISGTMGDGPYSSTFTRQ
jgi:hypothetical protein